uniref:Uncharacterized protein n=1 Tax=Knipowitschia caucasica TaxID=637954 RepID=A0AAV2J1U0_KNICA
MSHRPRPTADSDSDSEDPRHILKCYRSPFTPSRVPGLVPAERPRPLPMSPLPNLLAHCPGVSRRGCTGH